MSFLPGRGPKWWAQLRSRSCGAVLIEVLIALAVLGLISTVFAGAMYTSLQAARLADERSTVLTLAKSQIEFVRNAGYSEADWAYTVNTAGSSYTVMPSWWSTNPPPPLSTEYAGYSVAMSGVSDIDIDGTTGPDDGIRTITATVSHHGAVVFVLENYEVDR